MAKKKRATKRKAKKKVAKKKTTRKKVTRRKPPKAEAASSSFTCSSGVSNECSREEGATHHFSWKMLMDAPSAKVKERAELVRDAMNLILSMPASEESKTV